jgi:predicted sulfurtransferase
MSHYKTNEEQETITVEEFVNEWYNDKDYLLVDIREDGEKTELGAIKNAFNISIWHQLTLYVSCAVIMEHGLSK